MYLSSCLPCNYINLLSSFVFFSRYGPPLRTDYRILVENISSRVSWQVSIVDYTGYNCTCMHNLIFNTKGIKNFFPQNDFKHFKCFAIYLVQETWYSRELIVRLLRYQMLLNSFTRRLRKAEMSALEYIL